MKSKSNKITLNSIPFDFSPQTVFLKQEISNLRKVLTQELAIISAGIGGILFLLLADSKSWASFEAQKRATMAMHGIGCGNVCINSLKSEGLILIFVWLIFSSAVGSQHTDVNLYNVRQQNDMQLQSQNETMGNLISSGIILTLIKSKNTILDYQKIFDGVFEAQDKFGRYGFNQMNEIPNGAENVFVAVGIQFMSANLLQQINEFNILNQVNYISNSQDQITHSVKFISLLQRQILITLVMAQVQSYTFKSRNGQLFGSQYQLWHISNRMGLMHIPESINEKAFILLQTMCTTELANSVQVQFESVLDASQGRKQQFKTTYQQLSTDVKSGLWVIPLLIGLVSQLCFAIILKEGKLNGEVLTQAMIGFWDLGSSTGNGNIWPKQKAGKGLIMILQQPARYAVSYWHMLLKDNLIDPIISALIMSSQNQPEAKLLADFDQMKCQDQQFYQSKGQMNQLNILTQKYIKDECCNLMIDNFEPESKIVLYDDDKATESEKNDLVPFKIALANNINNINLDTTQIPIIDDNSDSSASSSSNNKSNSNASKFSTSDIPIITDEDSSMQENISIQKKSETLPYQYFWKRFKNTKINDIFKNKQNHLKFNKIKKT